MTPKKKGSGVSEAISVSVNEENATNAILVSVNEEKEKEDKKTEEKTGEKK